MRLMLLIFLVTTSLFGVEQGLDWTLERSKLKTLLKEKRSEAKVLRIALNKDQVQPSFYLRRGVREAKEGFYDAIIFDIDELELDILNADLLLTELKEFPGLVMTYTSAKLAGSANLLLFYADDNAASLKAKFLAVDVKMFNGREPDIDQAVELRKLRFKKFTDLAKERSKSLAFAEALADPINNPELKIDDLGVDDYLKFKIIQRESEDLEGFLKFLNFDQAQVDTYEDSWAFRFSFAMRDYLPVLWIILMIGLFTEMNTPGFGVGGSIGCIGLILCLFIQFQLGTAGVLDVSLIFIGLGLLLIEVLVLPGFGVAGILGIPCFGAGVIMSFINLEALPDNKILRHSYIVDSSLYAMFNISVIILGTFAGTLVLMYYLPKFRFNQEVVLENAIPSDVTIKDPELVQGKLDEAILLSSQGIALTDLRPVGNAEFCHVHLDVVSQGELIAKDAKLKVVEVEANRILVEEIKDV